MFAKFKYEPLPLGDIYLDKRNPRIVTQQPLNSQEDILEYLLEHEDLISFIKKISHAGKNKGAERPYVVRDGTQYIVIEGNSRIAAYKVLAGLIAVPAAFQSSIPQVSNDLKSTLLVVDATIAPTRDALLPIMADSHFGVGDKSKWGYLGSRKAIYDEFTSGKTIAQLAKAFDVAQSAITDYLLEYELYLEALSLKWTQLKRNVLHNPRIAFNPPVRFLETKGHKSEIGISYDRPNIKVKFVDDEAKRKFKHLVLKLAVNPESGLGATASFADVFSSYVPSTSSAPQPSPPSPPTTPMQPLPSPPSTAVAPNALFNYPVGLNNNLLRQLMKEAASINAKKLPSSATFLIRNLLEVLLKHKISECNANSQNSSLSLEGAISLCKSKSVPLSSEDKKVLKDFEKSHLDYVNLGAHGNIVPHVDRVMQIRDFLDEFIRKNVA